MRESATIVYIMSNHVSHGLGSQGRRVSTYTVIMVLITLIVGVYIFLELNFIIGFLMVMLGALIYYTRKRLEGVS
jgi:sugar phosphate permease